MATLGVIKVPNCKDRAYTWPQVEMVMMVMGCHTSNVEGTQSKDTVLMIKDLGEIWVHISKIIEQTLVTFL